MPRLVALKKHYPNTATVQGVLERAGIVCSDLRGETLNLEDAFIGLTGKY